MRENLSVSVITKMTAMSATTTHLLVLRESVLLSQGDKLWTMDIFPVGPELIPCELWVTFQVVQYLDASCVCSLARHLSRLECMK